jgi:hypothetical protein
MRTVAAVCVTAVLLLTWAARAEAPKPIEVGLADFKFKVPETMASLFGHNEGEGKLFFYTNGAAEATVKVPADGEYQIIVKASCDPAQNENAKFKLSIDGEAVGQETTLTAADTKDYTLTAKLKKGDRKLSIAFTNDVYKEGEFDRNLYVHGVTLKQK